MSQLPVQTQIDSLNARVSVIDGQGLVAPAVGYTVTTNARITGLKTDLTQSVLTLEGLLTVVNKSITGLWVALSTYLGFNPPGSGAGQTVIPPSGDGSGTPAVLSIGSVTVLPPGSTPTVVDSGVPSAAILNFGIPAGQDGDPGTTSPATSATIGGVKIAVGQTSSVLASVATTGAYTDLTGKPTLGTSASMDATQFDAAGLAVSASTSASSAALTSALAAANLKANNLSDVVDPVAARTHLGLATVASSGAYADLAGAPAIQPAATLRKMRALSAAADVSNLIDNAITATATVATPSPAPAVTGYTNITPAASGFAGKLIGSTTLGSNVVTITSITTGTVLVGMPVFTNGRLTVDNGAIVTSVTPSTGTPTSFTMSKVALGSGTGQTIYTASNLFDIIGGTAVSSGNNFTVSGATTGNGVNPPTGQFNAASPYALEFYTDAANFTTAAPGVMLQFFTNGVSPAEFRVAVDGAYQSANPITFGNGYITIQFAAAGIHKVRVEIQSNIVLLNMYIFSPARVWRTPSASNVHVGFFGDSYFQNGATGSFSMRNIAATTASLMGWTPDFLSVGGTGYINSGGTNYAWTSAFRIADVSRRNYSAIVIFGSVNDSGHAATLGAAALTVWAGIRALNPNAVIWIFGVPPTATLLVAASSVLETALQTAFASWGDTNSYFIPISNDPDGPWITPSNAAIYIASDGTHPTDGVGTLYYGKMMSQKIKQILQSSDL